MDDRDIITSKEAVKALFRECGGHKAVAHDLDVSLARVYAFTDSASPEHNLSFKRVARLTTPQATSAARYLARKAGGVFLPVPTTEAATTVTAISNAVREHGEAIAAALTAMADGRITADEVTPVVKEIDDAFAALATLRGMLVTVAKEG
jgi:hypothetical protein